MRSLLAIFALLVIPHTSPAQVQIELTPFAGVFTPTTSVASVDNGGCDFDSFLGFGCSAVVSQKTAPIVGAALTAWFGKRFGLDMAFGYSASPMMSEPDGGYSLWAPAGPGGDTTAHILTGAVRVLTNVSVAATRLKAYAITGVAVLEHGGDGYRALLQQFPRQVSGGTNWGPIVGVGFRVGVTRGLSSRMELQDCIYVHGPGAAPGHFRGDFGLTLGLSAKLAGAHETRQ